MILAVIVSIYSLYQWVLLIDHTKRIEELEKELLK